jgi:hypothetical protein
MGGEMKGRFRALLLLLAVSVFCTTVPPGVALLFSHHGRGSTFDMSKMTELKGAIKEVQWRNPHIGIFIDVKDKNSKVVTWAIEHSNVITLAEEGYNRNTLKPGQEVTAVINAGTGGRPIGYLFKIILPDGKEIFHRRGTN